MQVAGLLGGGGPVMHRYMTGITIGTAGVPVRGSRVRSVTNEGLSVALCGASDPIILGENMGVCLSTSGTVAQTGTAEADLFVEVVVNPDQIINCRASGDTTAGTALTAQATSAASSDGSVTTGVTTLDDGIVYCSAGANRGTFRGADDTSGSLEISFAQAIASGDEFIPMQGFPGTAMVLYWDHTTDLTEVDGATSVVDMDNYACYDIKIPIENPTTQSFYQFIMKNHRFSGITNT